MFFAINHIGFPYKYKKNAVIDRSNRVEMYKMIWCLRSGLSQIQSTRPVFGETSSVPVIGRNIMRMMYNIISSFLCSVNLPI